MKFAHFADVHIGSWRDQKMKVLVSDAFTEAISKCIEESIDFLLIFNLTLIL